MLTPVYSKPLPVIRALATYVTRKARRSGSRTEKETWGVGWMEIALVMNACVGVEYEKR